MQASQTMMVIGPCQTTAFCLH